MIDVRSAVAMRMPHAAARAHPARTAAMLGAGAALLSFAGSGIPSYWGDEAASVLSAERTLPGLFGLLGQIDAVHGAYYLFLHFWVQLLGTGEWAVRAPSAVAIGVAAAGCCVLGRRLFGPATGLLAGILFAVLPQATHMGAEARSYAFTMAAATWLLIWLLMLLDRQEQRPRVWAGYGVATAGSIYLFLYLGLMLPVGAVVLVILRAPRRTWAGWARAAALALLLALPILVAAVLQRAQISFLAERGYATPDAVLVSQWFGWPGLALLAWALIVIALLGAVRALPASHGAAAQRAERIPAAMGAALPHRDAVLIVTAWLVLPTAAVLLVNAVALPVYSVRYLAFSAPAAALLMAVGLRAVATWALGPWRASARRQQLGLLAGTLVIAALAAPSYLGQRTPFAQGGSDLRQLAETVAANGQRGDAVVFDESVRPSLRPRLALDLYPAHFADYDDVMLDTRYVQRTRLWDTVRPLAELGARVQGHSTVWAVERGADRPDVTALEALGYRVDAAMPINTTTVFKLTKEQP
ncbi:glycosyltransferase family 39 protein [Microterricola viridarii]|uniref:Mannosyltransferase n=1 Tax=Microterricola viridarii TaxID=412690 RepID=A0A1H1PH31_9MICO|nr:glycosyltransferase family 39 protein [Microterricola viridarii]SDS10387.1 mannosyltransferase [Microterricola viridarii]